MINNSTNWHSRILSPKRFCFLSELEDISNGHIPEGVDGNDPRTRKLIQRVKNFYGFIGANRTYIDAGPALDRLIIKRVLGLESNIIRGLKPSLSMNAAIVVAELMWTALDCDLKLEHAVGEYSLGWAARFDGADIPKYEIFTRDAPHSVSLAALVAIGFLSTKRKKLVNIRACWEHPAGLKPKELLRTLKAAAKRS